MTPLERLREQVEASDSWVPADIPAPALIRSSTRLARALCDPGTVTMVARAVAGVDIGGQVPVTASEIDTAQAILNALAGMGVGNE